MKYIGESQIVIIFVIDLQKLQQLTRLIFKHITTKPRENSVLSLLNSYIYLNLEVVK